MFQITLNLNKQTFGMLIITFRALFKISEKTKDCGSALLAYFETYTVKRHVV
jgi:hypothetical protein